MMDNKSSASNSDQPQTSARSLVLGPATDQIDRRQLKLSFSPAEKKPKPPPQHTQQLPILRWFIAPHSTELLLSII